MAAQTTDQYKGEEGQHQEDHRAADDNGSLQVDKARRHAEERDGQGANPRVSVTIHSATKQDHVLLMRGTAAVTMVPGVAREYAAAARKYMGEEAGNAWVGEVGTLFAEMARIAIRPDWVGVLDFQIRFPSAMQPFLETAAAQATHQAQS
jgi:hypothetical protein